jgi:cytochrome c oxidase assembly protein subunit 15
MKSSSGNGNIFFRKISLITLVAVYFLILVGGIVRSTGAGMGCPDWPKCFGQWIPPTSEEMLPEDYREKYKDDRLEKNQRFADYLEAMGLKKQAYAIRTEKFIQQETSFNAVKTWTEYINRIVGVVIGLLIILNLVGAISLIKTDPAVFMWAFFLFLLVVFQGWIGSIVVSTHLTPWIITLHMLIAVLIIAILTYLVFRSRKNQLFFQPVDHHRFLNFLLVLSGLLIVVQILLGTQVREAVDFISSSLGYRQRDTWIGSLGIEFYVHRSFSLILLVLQAGILINISRKKAVNNGSFRFSRYLFILLLVEIGLGISMAYFGIPPYLQPLHLLTGVILFGMQFLLLLMINNRRRVPVEKEVMV